MSEQPKIPQEVENFLQEFEEAIESGQFIYLDDRPIRFGLLEEHQRSGQRAPRSRFCPITMTAFYKSKKMYNLDQVAAAGKVVGLDFFRAKEVVQNADYGIPDSLRSRLLSVAEKTPHTSPHFGKL